MSLLSTYITQHTDRIYVNDDEGNPEDEHRTETTIYYHIHIHDSYKKEIYYTIDAERVVEEFYYDLYSQSKQNVENYYIPYNIIDVYEKNISFKNNPLYTRDKTNVIRYAEKLVDVLKQRKKYHETTLFPELLEKTLHPNRLEWFVDTETKGLFTGF